MALGEVGLWLATPSPNEGEGVGSQTLSQQRCVVADHLNKFQISFHNRSCGPLKNIFVMQNV